MVRGLGLAPTLASATLAATLFAPSDFGFPDALVGLVDEGPANGTLPGMVDLPDALRQVGAREWGDLGRPCMTTGVEDPSIRSSLCCLSPPSPTHTKAAWGPPAVQILQICMVHHNPPLCGLPSLPSRSCCLTTCMWAPAFCPPS